MATTNTLIWLDKKLYPTGRVFRMPEPQTGVSGNLYKWHRALNKTFANTYADALQILNEVLPDNSLFTIDDAHDWYRRLGIYDSGSVVLSDMKLAIAQKLSFALTPLNKRNYLFIQQQLQAAGFNVYVYENRFSDGMGGWITKTPNQVFSPNYKVGRYGGFRYGQIDYGYLLNSVTRIANYIEENKDSGFDHGSNYKSTFFISGNPINSIASVPKGRHDEFRQLILKLKPLQAVGYLFINYT